MSFFRLYRRVVALLRPEARIAIVLVLANIVLAAAQFAEPVLFGRVIDRLTSGVASRVLPTLGSLSPLIAAWVGFALTSITLAMFVSLQADRMAHRQRLSVMARYFEHVLHLPLSFHAKTHSGRSLKVMIESANGLFMIYLTFFRESAAAVVATVVLLPLSLVLNWRLGLLLIGLMVVFFGLIAFVRRRTEVLQTSVERFNSSLAERVSDALGNVPVIQSFTRIESEASAMRGLSQNVLRAQMPVLTWWAMAVVGSKAAATVTLLLIFVFGTSLYLRGLGTIGEIVMFMNFASMLIGRLEQLANFTNMLFLQAPRLVDYFDVLDMVPNVADMPGARDPGRLLGRVRFEGVGFTYPGSARPAVSDLDFTVEPGQTVALVGATGSGKSTTLSLLHRVYDPRIGRITIDGEDIRAMPLDALRRNIGVVFQEPMLFARSIEENLVIGKPDATQVDIAHALDLAQASDFVGRQTDGLRANVGERGRLLSGGERQRLAIARALLKDPPVMIFDEATAALDATTEQKLQLALAKATEGRTTFIIAHRLATIRHASKILVFEAGRIVEAGGFDELVAKNGVFCALARAQFMTDRAETQAAE
ncbi:MAG: glucan ABC transporter ATP-binding protein/ permease [Beijerinckiaceae bacterium]|nr:glucan ABC transporter ATP-binding protein/ permease [Beijerinckiaceae bacterium]